MAPRNIDRATPDVERTSLDERIAAGSECHTARKLVAGLDLVIALDSLSVGGRRPAAGLRAAAGLGRVVAVGRTVVHSTVLLLMRLLRLRLRLLLLLVLGLRLRPRRLLHLAPVALNVDIRHATALGVLGHAAVFVGLIGELGDYVPSVQKTRNLW